MIYSRVYEWQMQMKPIKQFVENEHIKTTEVQTIQRPSYEINKSAFSRGFHFINVNIYLVRDMEIRGLCELITLMFFEINNDNLHEIDGFWNQILSVSSDAVRAFRANFHKLKCQFVAI